MKAKYIDTGKLIAEIKGKIAEIEKEPAPPDRETILLQTCKINAFREVLGVIKRLEKTSLQQEQPEVDLEKEIDKFLNETGAPYLWCNDDEQKEWCNIIARHFAEWGATHLNVRKEEK